jgi:uncharacterized membrane protein
MKPLIIILALFAISCSPSKRINRIVKKHPELLVKDTIKVIDTVVIESVHYDTTTKFLEHKTVEVINNERVNLKYRYDTITNEIHHYVECKGDTIIREIQVPYEKIQPVTVKKNNWITWLMLLLILLVVSTKLKH